MQKGKKWNTGLIATVWSSSASPTFNSRVWKTISTLDIAITTDNIQKTAKREVSEQLGGVTINLKSWPLPSSQRRKNASKLELQESGLEALQEITDIYTKSIKNASNFNSAVLKAAKESIPRSRRHDYKPHWNKTLEKIHKERSEAREEMERNPTPQNVRRHFQLKTKI